MSQLDDPRRLAALFETGVLDTAPEPAFDRLAQLAGRLLGVGNVSVTLLDDQRQYTKASVGMDVAGSAKPVSAAVCRFVVESGRPFAFEDANHPAMVGHFAIAAGLEAYLGVPLTTRAGYTLGALCVFQDTPRAWTPTERVALEDLAASVTSELELRATLTRLRRRSTFAELLHAAAADANAATSSRAALVACMHRICVRLELAFAQAYVVESGPGGARLVATDTFEADAGRPQRFREVRGALAGRVLATGQTAWSDDLATDSPCFAMPVIIGTEVVAVVEMIAHRAEPPDDALLAVLADIGVQLGRVFERERAQRALAELSLVDELTGLRNRRGFLELARHQLKQADRSGRTACLFFADLDGLKSINDTLGHEIGDAAIRAMAQVLQQSFRETDVLARLGGDELVCFALDLDLEQAAGCRDRVLANVAAYNAHTRPPFRLAASVGIAVYDPRAPRPLEVLLADADHLMYAQKRARKLAATPAMTPASPSPVVAAAVR